MLISAMFLLRLQQHLGEDKLQLVGDTLVNAIRGKPDDWLARLPAMKDSYGEPIPIRFNDEPAARER